MTGFGKGSASDCGLNVDIEITSVNRKQLDIRFNTPAEIKPFEPEFKKLLTKTVSRGAVNIRFNLEFDESLLQTGVSINEQVVEKYISQFSAIAARNNLDSKISIEAVMNLPEVVVMKEINMNDIPVKEICLKALTNALTELDEMRLVEGTELKLDSLERLETLKQLTENIAQRNPLILDEYKQKLAERVAKLLHDTPELNCELLTREVAYFADKSDISEEMTRLQSHFSQFEKICQKEEPVGRSLDFLIQEIFREINTTGSKANDAEILQNVVRFKTELEKIREQIQNVE